MRLSPFNYSLPSKEGFPVQIQTAIGLLLFEQEKIRVHLDNLYLYGQNTYPGFTLTNEEFEDDWAAARVKHLRYTARLFLARHDRPLILSNN